MSMKGEVGTMAWFLAAILLSFLNPGRAVADPKYQLYQRYLDRQLQPLIGADRGFFDSIFASLAGDTTTAEPNIQALTFDQLVSHDNASDPDASTAGPRNARTFSQRYYLLSDYAAGADAPVIFYICGEAACTERNLRGAILTYAKKYNAHLIALEHRFYGKSQPFPLLSAENLKLLTTDLALKDLASFQRYAREKHALRGKWISIGGSYPGSLSAYYRLKFPDLVVGALASSAPVQARENFEEYDHHVATVAGEACAVKMREAVRQVESVIDDPAKFAEIKKLFDASDVKDPVDFMYVLADMGAIAIQYGYKSQFCDELLTGPDVIAAYASAGKKMFQLFGITALQDSFQGCESEDPKTYEDDIGMRQWMFQSCLEYGYFQNAYHDPAITVRSARINPAYHTGVCKRLFGLEGPVNISGTNSALYEPLLSPTTTSIFFTNGSTDPWSKLGISPANGNAVNPNVDLFLIDGAAHCDDLRAPKPTDSDAVKTARAVFEGLATRWLK